MSGKGSLGNRKNMCKKKKKKKKKEEKKEEGTLVVLSVNNNAMKRFGEGEGRDYPRIFFMQEDSVRY